MEHVNERRSQPLAEQIMAWINRGAVGLGLFFLSQIYQDLRTSKDDIAAMKIDIAVLKERTHALHDADQGRPGPSDPMAGDHTAAAR